MCQAAKYAADLETGDVVVAYHVVTDAVIKLLRLNSGGSKPAGRSMPIKREGLKQLLRESGQELAFGEWVAETMMGVFPDQTGWVKRIDV